MGNVVEPKVFLIGETQANTDGIAALMAHYGVPEWRSDAESSAELITEIYGRCCLPVLRHGAETRTSRGSAGRTSRT